jgi:hypothetical protein
MTISQLILNLYAVDYLWSIRPALYVVLEADYVLNALDAVKGEGQACCCAVLFSLHQLPFVHPNVQFFCPLIALK